LVAASVARLLEGEEVVELAEVQEEEAEDEVEVGVMMAYNPKANITTMMLIPSLTLYLAAKA